MLRFSRQQFKTAILFIGIVLLAVMYSYAWKAQFDVEHTDALVPRMNQDRSYKSNLESTPDRRTYVKENGFPTINGDKIRGTAANLPSTLGVSTSTSLRNSSDIITGFKANIETNINTDIKTDIKTDIDPYINSNIGPDSKSGIDSDIKADIDIKPQVTIEPKGSIETTVSPKKSGNGHSISTQTNTLKLVDRELEKATSTEKSNSLNTKDDEPTTGSQTQPMSNDKSKEAAQRSKIWSPPPGEKCIKRLPQAIVVGIQKCGTSAILTFLNKHPQIAACMNPIETKYFSLHYNKPLSYYRNLMPCSYSNQVTMEKSPPYFYRPYCAARIKKMNPRTKIVIIVKDPIVRTQSNYAMRMAHRTGSYRSFEKFVTRPGNPYKVIQNEQMIKFSEYSNYMKGWLKYFPLKQILIVDGHGLETDPATELTKVETFLNIDHYFTHEMFPFNKQKGKHCFKENGKSATCLGSNKGRKHPSISPVTRKALEKYFKPRNEQFFKMIKRRFDWGY